MCAGKMKRATAAQVEAGQRMARDLTDASIRYSMRGLGGAIPLGEYNTWNFEHKDIIMAYLTGDIESTEAIWIAMNRAA